MDKICPYCQGQHLIKNGSAYGVPTRRAAPAKWKCKDCLRQTSFAALPFGSSRDRQKIGGAVLGRV